MAQIPNKQQPSLTNSQRKTSDQIPNTSKPQYDFLEHLNAIKEKCDQCTAVYVALYENNEMEQASFHNIFEAYRKQVNILADYLDNLKPPLPDKSLPLNREFDELHELGKKIRIASEADEGQQQLSSTEKTNTERISNLVVNDRKTEKTKEINKEGKHILDPKLNTCESLEVNIDLSKSNSACQTTEDSTFSVNALNLDKIGAKSKSAQTRSNTKIKSNKTSLDVNVEVADTGERESTCIKSDVKPKQRRSSLPVTVEVSNSTYSCLPARCIRQNERNVGKSGAKSSKKKKCSCEVAVVVKFGKMLTKSRSTQTEANTNPIRNKDDREDTEDINCDCPVGCDRRFSAPDLLFDENGNKSNSKTETSSDVTDNSNLNCSPTEDLKPSASVLNLQKTDAKPKPNVITADIEQKDNINNCNVNVGTDNIGCSLAVEHTFPVPPPLNLEKKDVKLQPFKTKLDLQLNQNIANCEVAIGAKSAGLSVPFLNLEKCDTKYKLTKTIDSCEMDINTMKLPCLPSEIPLCDLANQETKQNRANTTNNNSSNCSSIEDPRLSISTLNLKKTGTSPKSNIIKADIEKKTNNTNCDAVVGTDNIGCLLAIEHTFPVPSSLNLEKKDIKRKPIKTKLSLAPNQHKGNCEVTVDAKSADCLPSIYKSLSLSSLNLEKCDTEFKSTKTTDRCEVDADTTKLTCLPMEIPILSLCALTKLKTKQYLVSCDDTNYNNSNCLTTEDLKMTVSALNLKKPDMIPTTNIMTTNIEHENNCNIAVDTDLAIDYVLPVPLALHLKKKEIEHNTVKTNVDLIPKHKNANCEIAVDTKSVGCLPVPDQRLSSLNVEKCDSKSKVTKINDGCEEATASNMLICSPTGIPRLSHSALEDLESKQNRASSDIVTDNSLNCSAAASDLRLSRPLNLKKTGTIPKRYMIKAHSEQKKKKNVGTDIPCSLALDHGLSICTSLNLEKKGDNHESITTKQDLELKENKAIHEATIDAKSADCLSAVHKSLSLSSLNLDNCSTKSTSSKTIDSCDLAVDTNKLPCPPTGTSVCKGAVGTKAIDFLLAEDQRNSFPSLHLEIYGNPSKPTSSPPCTLCAIADLKLKQKEASYPLVGSRRISALPLNLETRGVDSKAKGSNEVANKNVAHSPSRSPRTSDNALTDLQAEHKQTSSEFAGSTSTATVNQNLCVLSEESSTKPVLTKTKASREAASDTDSLASKSPVHDVTDLKPEEDKANIEVSLDNTYKNGSSAVDKLSMLSENNSTKLVSTKAKIKASYEAVTDDILASKPVHNTADLKPGQDQADIDISRETIYTNSLFAVDRLTVPAENSSLKPISTKTKASCEAALDNDNSASKPVHNVADLKPEQDKASNKDYLNTTYINNSSGVDRFSVPLKKNTTKPKLSKINGTNVVATDDTKLTPKLSVRPLRDLLPNQTKDGSAVKIDANCLNYISAVHRTVSSHSLNLEISSTKSKINKSRANSTSNGNKVSCEVDNNNPVINLEENAAQTAVSLKKTRAKHKFPKIKVKLDQAKEKIKVDQNRSITRLGAIVKDKYPLKSNHAIIHATEMEAFLNNPDYIFDLDEDEDLLYESNVQLHATRRKSVPQLDSKKPNRRPSTETSTITKRYSVCSSTSSTSVPKTDPLPQATSVRERIKRRRGKPKHLTRLERRNQNYVIHNRICTHCNKIHKLKDDEEKDVKGQIKEVANVVFPYLDQHLKDCKHDKKNGENGTSRAIVDRGKSVCSKAIFNELFVKDCNCEICANSQTNYDYLEKHNDNPQGVDVKYEEIFEDELDILDEPVDNTQSAKEKYDGISETAPIEINESGNSTPIPLSLTTPPCKHAKDIPEWMDFCPFCDCGPTVDYTGLVLPDFCRMDRRQTTCEASRPPLKQKKKKSKGKSKGKGIEPKVNKVVKENKPLGNAANVKTSKAQVADKQKESTDENTGNKRTANTEIFANILDINLSHDGNRENRFVRKSCLVPQPSLGNLTEGEKEKSSSLRNSSAHTEDWAEVFSKRVSREFPLISIDTGMNLYSYSSWIKYQHHYKLCKPNF